MVDGAVTVEPVGRRWPGPHVDIHDCDLVTLDGNTAATNILVPIAIAASAGYEQQTVIPLALGASAAMYLPISTPPNAIAYGTSRLEARDLLQVGIFIGLLAPIIITAWCLLVLPLQLQFLRKRPSVVFSEIVTASFGSAD